MLNFAELRQRNPVPTFESPGGAPLQRTISEPSLAEAVSAEHDHSGTSKQLKEPLEARKSNSLMDISFSSSGGFCLFLTFVCLRHLTLK